MSKIENAAGAKAENQSRDHAIGINPFVGINIKNTAGNVAAGLSYLSYASGNVQDGTDKMAFGLDLLLQVMGKALDFEAAEQ